MQKVRQLNWENLAIYLQEKMAYTHDNAAQMMDLVVKEGVLFVTMR